MSFLNEIDNGRTKNWFCAVHLQVIAPILENEENHKRWPAVVSQDVAKQILKMKNLVFIISGQSKGQTLLPIPPGAEKLTAEAINSGQ